MTDSRHRRAAAAEALAAQLLLRAGYDVFSPMLDGSPIDLVAIGHDQIIIAQVRLMVKGTPSQVSSYLKIVHGGDSKSRFEDTPVNTIIGVSRDYQRVFIVPESIYSQEERTVIPEVELMQRGLMMPTLPTETET